MKLMTHLVIGYPTFEDTIALAKTLEKAGADMLELQIPFSDPVADGPTIMRACEQALKQEFSITKAFDVISQIAKEVAIPLYIMAYYNTVFRYGVEKFCQLAKKAGVSGLIIPDMPIEEESEEHLFRNCQKYGLENIRVVAPVSTEERLTKNAKVATGFVYATAHQGTTGAQKNQESRIKNQEFINYLQRIRKHFKIPVAVGFGISSKEEIRLLNNLADIVIVGSAIIDVVNQAKKENRLQAVADFIESLKVVE